MLITLISPAIIIHSYYKNMHAFYNSFWNWKWKNTIWYISGIVGGLLIKHDFVDHLVILRKSKDGVKYPLFCSLLSGMMSGDVITHGHCSLLLIRNKHQYVHTAAAAGVVCCAHSRRCSMITINGGCWQQCLLKRMGIYSHGSIHLFLCLFFFFHSTYYS